MDIEEIVKETVNCAVKVRRYLGEGFLESVYQEALLIELRKVGLNAEKEIPVKVIYEDGSEIGLFKVDVLVEDCLILELKTVGDLTERHEMQLVNYLKASRLDTGLLINFWGEKIKIKRKYRQSLSRGTYDKYSL